ncbi:hypothetical protein [Paenibacillus terrae]|uniref:hypothetical protein n=1 Tax=Paenibacillus terrae TaxID=159743 RepID=UPI0011EB2232|nr:hypothetical protein [Paenibacillus terrae]
MKKKIRQIVVEGQTYEYLLNHHFVNGQSINVLKVFWEGKKIAPLLVTFLTWNDPIGGSPLATGVELYHHRSGVSEIYNLNYPKIVRAWILHGLESGWTGKETWEIEDALSTMTDMGYEAQWLRPKA